MAQRDLQRVLKFRGVGGQRRQQTGRRRSNVGSQRQRVDALDADDADADQRRQGRREHRTGLHDERDDGAEQHRQVARQPRHVRNVGVDDALDQIGHVTWARSFVLRKLEPTMLFQMHEADY